MGYSVVGPDPPDEIPQDVKKLVLKSFSNLKRSKASVRKLKLQVDNAARQLDYAAIKSKHENDIAAIESELEDVNSELEDANLEITALIMVLNSRRDAAHKEDFTNVNVMLDATTMKIIGTSLLSDQSTA